MNITNIFPNRRLCLLSLAFIFGSFASITSPAAMAGVAEKKAIAANIKVRLVTNLGNLDLQLFAARAPKTVGNFLARVDEGFYDGLVFHRVVANFVIQAGGYDKDLTYREPPGTVENESYNGASNIKGSVAMARLNDPDSADTQFFINMRDNARLDGAPGKPGYTVFGQLIAGWDVAEKIELSNTALLNGMAGVPEQPITILSTHRL